MSFHSDPERWLFEAKPENCPYCLKLDDPNESDTLALFENTEVCSHPNVCLKGTCYVIAREHYVELFDIPPDILAAIMAEIQVAAKALKEVTGAFKINYEIHGNSAPHFHMHLFPRYIDDPFPGSPIDYRQVHPCVYKDSEYNDFVSSMQSRLKDHQSSKAN